MMKRILFVVFCVACSGGPAGSDPSDPCVAGGDSSLDIGEGIGGYTPLQDGNDIELVHGPQGGYHVEIGLNAINIDASELLGGTIQGRIGGEVRANSAPWLDFRCDAGNGLQSWGTRLIFDGMPEDLHLQEVVIDAEVTDMEGTKVSGTKTLRIFDPSLE